MLSSPLQHLCPWPHLLLYSVPGFAATANPSASGFWPWPYHELQGGWGGGAGDKKVEEEDTRIWFCFSGLSLCLQKHQNLWWSSKGSSLTPNLLPFAESTDLFIKIVQRFQKWWNPWPGLIFLLITMAKSGQDKKEMVLKALESDHNQQKLEGNLLLRVEL